MAKIWPSRHLSAGRHDGRHTAISRLDGQAPTLVIDDFAFAWLCSLSRSMQRHHADGINTPSTDMSRVTAWRYVLNRRYEVTITIRFTMSANHQVLSDYRWPARDAPYRAVV